MKELNKKFPNIYVKEGKKALLFTLTKLKQPLFDEDIKKDSGNRFRFWDPFRSKLAAGLVKSISQIGIRQNDHVLYLGASHGYTSSFVSDIVGPGGLVYCLDFSARVVRDLYFVCEKVDNMIPLLADAKKPESYEERITKVNCIYQDIAQRDQVSIFLKNCKKFLKQGSFGIIAIKSRSIDVTKKPKDIFKQVRIDLEKEVTVADYRVLDPYEKDHALFVCKMR